MRERREQLISKFPEKDLDAILVSSPENRQYLSGFTGSAGYLLVSKGQAVLATDSRYTEQAANQAASWDVRQVRAGWDWLLDWLDETGARRLGFESQEMTVAAYESILEALKQRDSLSQVSLVAASGMAEDQRTVKDSQERAMLQKAIDVSDAAMQAVCPQIQEGMTEREVALAHGSRHARPGRRQHQFRHNRRRRAPTAQWPTTIPQTAPSAWESPSSSTWAPGSAATAPTLPAPSLWASPTIPSARCTTLCSALN